MPIRFGGAGAPTADEKALTTILGTGQLPPMKGSFAGSDLIQRLMAGPGGMGTDSDIGDLSFEDLLAMGWGDGGGGGGGGGGGASRDYMGEMAAGHEQAKELMGMEQQFLMDQAKRDAAARAEEAEKQRVYEREQAFEQIRSDRQKMFTDMLGKDPVRAVLFAMGVGDEAAEWQNKVQGLGDGAIKGLPSLDLKGAPTPEMVEQSLQGMLGGKVGLGKAGVTGLPSAVKAATAFSAGQGKKGAIGDIGAGRTMLTSALGVGATKGKGKPGMSREEVLRQIASVTPQGAF